jgi:hypothetical protein
MERRMSGRVWLAMALSLGACDRAAEPVDASAETPIADRPPTEAGGTGAPQSSAADGTGPACVTPLVEPPPPTASSLETCPTDPDGRPVMPRGTVTFDDREDSTGEARSIAVEIATTSAHRAHGLMYRPTLGDDEGMLFSWAHESPRSFWMRNTCLALDMMFIDDDGYIVGILEQVPPWNDQPRRSPCPAAHVLEVRAGFSRDHGVMPGQHITIEP